ncbi:MAG: hypothetical protein WAX14_13715 [Rhodococcus sp. (in: high G+C Gram-positive bacteria)]|uniref:hypothetical protein n=1 Tax=Rhodococcus sp. TaxID=1831 RepID=UPI003BB6E7FD
MWSRRLFGGMAVACMVATVGGCGSEAGNTSAFGQNDGLLPGTSVPGRSVTASVPDVTPAQRLYSALVATDEFDTMRADYVLVASGGAETRATYQVGRDPDVMYMVAVDSGAGMGGLAGGGEILAQGEEILLRFPSLNEIAGMGRPTITRDTWLRPEGDSRAMFGFVDELQSDPRSVLLLYRNSFATVVESGRAWLEDGRLVVRYDATIDFAKLLSELAQLYPETVGDATAADLAVLGFPSRIEYSVGEDGLVHRTVSTMDEGMQAGTMTTDYHSFGLPLDLPDIDRNAVQPLSSPSPDACAAPRDLRGMLLVQSSLDCDQATEVVVGFLDLREKYGTVGEWDCRILGAANAEEHGYYLSCDKSSDEWIRIENP